MTKPIPSPTPALAAIAAVLALTSTPALAQEMPEVGPDAAPATAVPASPAPSLPDVVPVVPPAPAATVQLPLPPIASSPSAPARAQFEPAVAEPALPSTSERATPERSASPAASTPRAASSTPSPAQIAVPTPGRDVATMSVPIIVPPEMRAPQVAPAPPAPIASGDDFPVAYWALGGGLAVLAGGIGALTLMRRRDRTMSRRRRHRLSAAPVGATPAEANDVRTPALTQEAPAADVAPASPLARPMTPEPRPMMRPMTAADDHAEALESMIAEPASAENPFVTRRKRLRRAEFILRTGQAPQPLHLPQTANLAPEASAAAPERTQVYDFGKSPGWANQRWKPITT